MKRAVYIKIPVNRAGFVNPVNVNWSEEKEQRLWKVLSKSKRSEVDWNSLSEQFGVSVSFLQQQAYWLYEHELEQLKSEIQKGVQSAETITEETKAMASPTPEYKPINNNDESLTSTKSFNMFENQPKQLRHVKKYVQLDPQPPVGHEAKFDQNTTFTQEQSESDSSSDSGDNFNQESVFLHRSRILSKPPPKFNDSDEDEDEVAEGFESISFNNESPGKVKTTTESSLSNLSLFSVSKSALEEALLDNSRF